MSDELDLTLEELKNGYRLYWCVNCKELTKQVRAEGATTKAFHSKYRCLKCNRETKS